jgi:hypothetical protein
MGALGGRVVEILLAIAAIGAVAAFALAALRMYNPNVRLPAWRQILRGLIATLLYIGLVYGCGALFHLDISRGHFFTFTGAVFVCAGFVNSKNEALGTILFPVMFFAGNGFIDLYLRTHNSGRFQWEAQGAFWILFFGAWAAIYHYKNSRSAGAGLS